ncbi:hypothetical protein EZI54_05310 [Marinobacter halodurans]|uniref:Arc family DNA-binding protein n=1 Tax=Marinobacter halodurans TaxID=2528979 RepID=A0ABY1ZN01_9GAMM|nr:hypothetical protein [Marinobacter halodurans]TBW57874.1 hypothetical protein EZI54_05310 [Marinobacter halodurans]
MKVTDLPAHWEGKKEESERPQSYTLRLPLEDAARIAALAELYPDRTETDILNDMIGAALDDLTRQTPLKGKLESVKK